jgi:hypothetical protein
LSNAQGDYENVKKAVERATRELHQMQRSGGPHQEAVAFDGQAGALLDAIARNKNMFRKPVLGPIGSCLSLEPSANKYGLHSLMDV